MGGDAFAQQLGGGGDGQVDRLVAHFLEGRGLGLFDLLQGLLLAPLDRLFQVRLSLLPGPLDLGLGMLDEGFGLFAGAALLALILGQQGLGILAQGRGFV